MSYALITGGAGSIGLHLARRLLQAGWRVDLLDSFHRATRDAELEAVVQHERVQIFDADLLAPGAEQQLGTGYSHIFHLAAILGVQNVLQQPAAVLDVNVRLTLAALAIARRQTQLERLLFASTSEVYAGTLGHYGLTIPTPETTPLTLPALTESRTSYMLSKLYGEALCLQSGLPVTLIRPHNIYGPRMGSAHVIPQMLERAWQSQDGQTFAVYSAEHTRTFCFVSDAVEMIYLLACSPKAVQATVNVGTQEPEIRMDELAEMVLQVVGRTLVLEPLPATEGSPARRAPDMSLCTELTGYTSTVGLQQGIERTLAWYADTFGPASSV